MKIRIRLSPFVVILLVVTLSAAAFGQRRDFLTDDEIEVIRDAQQIDMRIGVLVHAADRRFAALGVATSDVSEKVEKKEKKESDKWGAAPTGSRTELLDDVRRIIQKAIDDIDNLSTRPDSMVVDEPEKGKKPKRYEDVFPPAVHKLAAAARRFQPLLKEQLDKAQNEQEKGIVTQSIELCDEIIASESHLPSAPQDKRSDNR